MKYIFETSQTKEGEMHIEVSISGQNGITGSSKRKVSCFIKDNQFHYEESLENTLLSLINNTRLTMEERQSALEDADLFAIYCHASVVQQPVDNDDTEGIQLEEVQEETESVGDKNPE